MTVKLREVSVLTIDPDDLAAILTDYFCDGYNAFGRLVVDAVKQEGADFTITFAPKPVPEQIKEQE